MVLPLPIADVTGWQVTGITAAGSIAGILITYFLNRRTKLLEAADTDHRAQVSGDASVQVEHIRGLRDEAEARRKDVHRLRNEFQTYTLKMDEKITRLETFCERLQAAYVDVYVYLCRANDFFASLRSQTPNAAGEVTVSLAHVPIALDMKLHSPASVFRRAADGVNITVNTATPPPPET